MLLHLYVRNYVIVEALELDFGPGMTALTGETGAGKSILVDALGLVLGDRAEAGIVGAFGKDAEIAAEFDLSHSPGARRWLADNDLGDDPVCHLRRVIGANGRSRAYINMRSVPVQALAEVGGHIVDIHGQHAHQSLLRRDVQRALLDEYADNGELLTELRTAHETLSAARQARDTLRDSLESQREQAEWLTHQVQELEALELAEDEVPALELEHRRLANVGQLLSTCQDTLTILYEGEDGAAHDLLGRGLSALGAVLEDDPELQEAHDLVQTAQIQLEEAVEHLRRYTGQLDMSPERLQAVEARLNKVYDLARKHRVPAEELPATLARLRASLDDAEHGDERLAELEQQAREHEATYARLADSLSRRRGAAAATLAEKITGSFATLGMGGGRFHVALEPLPEHERGPHGQERVTFLVSTNPGQPPHALNKVVSGGELSRIGLAIQEILSAEVSNAPTMIFDEVDTGIGGAVAETVGRRLRSLADNRQVITITHLPQVASLAAHHLQVMKRSEGGGVQTEIRVLGEAERVEEIARMLGGLEITARTRAHAAEMLRQPTADA